MAQKVTTMVIKVNLACEKCRKKIKKVLCAIPQIQNKIYDEKANTVTITVVCCSPEKVKKMICCKGGKTVKGIEILKPPPPPETKAPTEKKPPTPKRKPPPETTPPPTTPKKEPPTDTTDTKSSPKGNGHGTGYPLLAPAGLCCRECYEGVGGGPCWEGYGRPVGPCYYRGYGRPVCNSWGCSYCKGYYTSRCTYYICEENPSACTIM